MAITLSDAGHTIPNRFQVWGEDLGYMMLHEGNDRQAADQAYEAACVESPDSLHTLRVYFTEDEFVIGRISQHHPRHGAV